MKFQDRADSEPGSNHAASNSNQQPGIMVFAGLGMLNAVCLGAGLVVGWLIDQQLGTLPLFLLLGLVAGISAGVIGTRAELKRYS